MNRAPSHPRRRLLALAILLVLSLGLGAALAIQAIQTARRHRDTARRALEDYAGFAAFILASRTYRQLGGAVVETFSGWSAGNPRPAPPAGTTCTVGTTWFEQPPGRPLTASGVPLLPAESAFLADTLRNAMPLLEETGWRFRFVKARSERFDGWFISSYRARNGFGVRGFTTCLGGTDSPFRTVMLAEHALPPALTDSMAADSLYSVAVLSHETRVYRSPASYMSPYRGDARLGTEFGDLRVELALRPELVSRLLIGGMPSSPTPLAIGLLGLSTMLVVTALLQLRREYELIGIRSEFVSNVSHELRTPLSQILIFTELLKLGRLRSDQERNRSIDIIDQEARRLIRLVENVLQFSRSGAGRRPVQRELLPLDSVVQDTVEAFGPLAAARGVALEAEVPAGAMVVADPSALRQILLNLLDNAIKYGPREQTVRIESESRNGWTRIMVDDQGPGIPESDRERVFEGYYRLPRERGSGVAGSGIGLAVVRSLAGEMGGRTWIEDTPTGGARVIVELASRDGAPQE